MAIHIRRREFILTLGGAAAAWPLVARAQQPAKLPTIGFLGSDRLAAQGVWLTAFLHRLHELGWIEGRNLAIWQRTRLARVLLRVCRDRAATSRAYQSSTPILLASDSSFCARLFLVFAGWRSWPM